MHTTVLEKTRLDSCYSIFVTIDTLRISYFNGSQTVTLKLSFEDKGTRSQEAVNHDVIELQESATT